MSTGVARVGLEKVLTGIRGLDEITGGGLPKGRTTLVCGSAGCGKTLFGVEFLVHGAVRLDEPGVLVTFEENAEEVTTNVASLGFDLAGLAAERKLVIDHVRAERSEIDETGKYDLEGLFIRIGHAIDSIGARRVVLDTVEALFASLSDEGILRAELRRLFRWLRDKGVTAVVTGERGAETLTRHGLEEYITDCVILLDLRIHEQVSTRRLRIVKYRGSVHGTNEYPYLIDEGGLSIFPITSLSLQHGASTERVSTGVPQLDAMLGGKGLYRGSSLLVSGTAGSGKTSLAACAAAAACARGERCIYFAFEESRDQIARNMGSIGVDLSTWIDADLLRFHAVRPTLFGLEMHLTTMHGEIEAFTPSLAVIDPITNLASIGTEVEVRAMLTRLIDYLKGRGITAVFTSLTSGGAALEHTEIGVSSLMDTWILVRFVEGDGERNRTLYVLKSRGMPHSNQVRELIMSERGVELADVHVGSTGVLIGAARHAQEARERAEAAEQGRKRARRRRAIERRRAVVAAQINALQAELAAGEADIDQMDQQDELREVALRRAREDMARFRDPRSPNGGSP